MPDEIGRVSIIAVGVWNYQHMDRLNGPQRDLTNLNEILVNDQELALYDPHKYVEIQNPNSAKLRDAITQFVIDRSIDNDVLLFYFSGHGAAIGANDFAFCTTDTNYLTEERVILPMTAVSFSEILKTLWIKKVIPVFIIDACFSGAASGSLITNIETLFDSLKGEIQSHYGSSYALMCSAPRDEPILDNPGGNGGHLVNALTNIAQAGINSRDHRTQSITLKGLFPKLIEEIEHEGINPLPILLLGPTLPEFSVFKNIHFRALEYRLQPHLVAVMQALWNDGNPRELRPSEIADTTGMKGSYGNHNKLSFEPWDLVESNGSLRRLNQRGLAFMRGELKVPRDVIKEGNIYVAKNETDTVGIEDFNI